MGDIALRGNKLTKKDVRKHYEEVKAAFPEDFKRKKPARTRKLGGGRTNLLEELGRVEGERSNPNRRAEISRVHGELNRGYAKGGRAGFKHGKKVGHKKQSTNTKKDSMSSLDHKKYELHKRGADVSFKDGGRTGFRHGKYVRTPVPHADISKYMVNKKEESPRKRDELSTMKKMKIKKLAGPRTGRPAAAEGGRIGFKKGTDKKWMQKVSASIKKRRTKGKCTPITKPGCTGRAKALAKTFKKMARERKSA